MLIPHAKQKEVILSNARFKVIRAGRRSGKSTVEIEEMVYEAVNGKDRSVFYIAPTQKQARSIIWESLKARVSNIGDSNESRLEMKLPTKDGGFSTIYITGWENRENFRGMKAHLIIFDELDTMKNFFIGWQEIFRPALTDTKGKSTFIGTPKKENPNLKRLEKIAETDDDYDTFHFTTYDNTFVDKDEIDKAKDELDYTTFKQEYLAEYVDNVGSMFKLSATIDVFTNTVEKSDQKFLIVDIADVGNDKTIFSFWEGMHEYRRETFSQMTTEIIIEQIREYAKEYMIPYSHIAVDAIGVGAGVASSSLLNGIVGFKSSYSAIKTDSNITTFNSNHVHSLAKEMLRTTDFKNLRSQCVFKLSEMVNNHKISSSLDGIFKENIIEELGAYQDVSKGDGKRMASSKDDIKQTIGRSPDDSDTWIMRMYFIIKEIVSPDTTEERLHVEELQGNMFNINKKHSVNNSTR